MITFISPSVDIVDVPDVVLFGYCSYVSLPLSGIYILLLPQDVLIFNFTIWAL